MDRSHPLTPQLTKDLLDLIKAGASPALAAEAVGVPAEVFEAWVERGERARSGKYHKLAQKVRQAQALAEVSLIGDVRMAARKSGVVALRMLVDYLEKGTGGRPAQWFSKRLDRRLMGLDPRAEPIPPGMVLPPGVEVIDGLSEGTVCPECRNGNCMGCSERGSCVCGPPKPRVRPRVPRTAVPPEG